MAKGCAAGLFLGSILKVLVKIVKVILKAIWHVLVFFGLIPMLFYVILGAVLHWIFGFDPRDGSLEAILYLIGFGGTALCAIVITLMHFFNMPVKSVVEGYKKPVWERKDEKNKKGERDKPAELFDDNRKRDVERRKSLYGYDKRDERPDNQEKPLVYYSAREKDTLIHEYSDRFEVFRIVDGKPVRDKTEYKNL